MKLSGKVAVITGGGRGIGREIALNFAKEGARVVICSKSKDELDKVALEIENNGGQVLSVLADISNEKEVDRLVQTAIDNFRGIDVLVNNAGITGPKTTVLNTDYQDWLQTFAINLNGAFLCSKYALTHMVKQKYGKIINISSTAGKKGGSHIAPYCASKAALISLTQSLAAEVGRDGVYVNAICPGAIKTQMLTEGIAELAEHKGLTYDFMENRFIQISSLGRLATASEVAHLALFLASEASSGITGETITVSAGASTSY
jgi:NAD(P)-dependent dehydrogenase (short-subunit alcohol dehydrogenase family)